MQMFCSFCCLNTTQLHKPKLSSWRTPEENPNLLMTWKNPTQLNKKHCKQHNFKAWVARRRSGNVCQRHGRDWTFHRQQECAAFLLRPNPGSSAGGRSRDPAGPHNSSQRSLWAHNTPFLLLLSRFFFILFVRFGEAKGRERKLFISSSTKCSE